MVINIENRVIEDIKRISKNYAVEKVVLFGSRARGDHKTTSDIDLAVFPLEEFNCRGTLISEFDDLETLYKVDVVLVDSRTDLNLLQNISKEGVVIYERTK